MEEKKAADAGGFSGDKNPEPPPISDHGVDFFYEKVCKLNETSGLSVVWVFLSLFSLSLSSLFLSLTLHALGTMYRDTEIM